MRTITMKKPFLSLSLGALLFAVVGTFSASAAAAPPQSAQLNGFRMPAKTISVEVQKEVAKARAIDPRAFVAVNGIVSRAAETNARARGRKAPIAIYLAKLGPSALMPMLEMLAVDPPRGVPATSAPGVRRDLIEAIGLLKDPRALPVLTSILEDTTEDAETTRTVAEAVARIGTEEAANHLLAALEASRGDRTRALLAGMGDCRRVRVTETLASHLRSTNDDAVARAVARSLGRAGNAWAWKTLADKSEEARIRETAARALVDAYVRRDGEARMAASNALMVVDAPQTPALIAQAKRGASPDAVKALDALAERFARNPARAN